jgi:hypothetical protein
MGLVIHREKKKCRNTEIENFKELGISHTLEFCGQFESGLIQLDCSLPEIPVFDCLHSVNALNYVEFTWEFLSERFKIP